MVINNFNGECIVVFPDEADTPLVINTDAVLPGPVAFQGFQAISGRHSHIIQSFSAVELHQFAKCGALDICGQTARSLAFPNLFRLFASETLNHSFTL
jgi:hypothetical protein